LPLIEAFALLIFEFTSKYELTGAYVEFKV